MSRKVTNEIIELCEQGVLSWESIARECLCHMSEYDVADMNNTAEFVAVEEEEND